MIKARAVVSLILMASLHASAAVINHSDAFSTATASGGDDSASTAAAHFLSYTESNPSTAGGTTEIRTQNNPFSNGGTLFLAALPNEAQSATYHASSTGIGASAGDTHWDTSVALTLSADFASNWKDPAATVRSGFTLEGTTGGLIIYWNPGGSAYSVGVSGLTVAPSADIVNGAAFSGAVSAPSGTGLAEAALSLIENGVNYDFTLTVGGADNTFSVPKSDLGGIVGIGFYNASSGGGGNTNIDSVSLSGATFQPSYPIISSFTVDDHVVAPGTSVTFSWETTDALSLSIDQGIGDVTSVSAGGNGSTNVIVNSTATYTLTASNAEGSSFAAVSIDVVEPALGVDSFTADDLYVSPGSEVLLSWETSEADTIEIDQGIGDVTALSTGGNGSTSIVINATTIYTITVSDGVESVTQNLRIVTGEPRPNIVFFMVDDMGWQDTSVPFHTSTTLLNQRFRTPNMENLAANGRKFTQAYACAVCSPTRVSLMTGMNAANHKVTNWTLNQNHDQSGSTASLKAPSNWNINGVGPMEEPASRVYKTDDTLPRLLQQAGYRTIHAGKAHFGANGLLGEDPANIGFDVNIAGHAAGGPGSYYGTDNFGSGAFHVPGLEQYHGEDIFLTEALTLEINKSIEKAVQDGMPFFAYMAHYAVHVPLALDSRFSANYPKLDSTEKKYATLVEGMDKSLGDIISKIDSLGVAEDTLVIFYSDNGGLSFSARGSSPYGGINTHNWPLRAGKGSSYEGGTRVPFIAGWAQANADNSFQQSYPIAVNTICDSPVIIEDMMPTVLAAAGIAPPSGIDGHDISGYINSTPGFQRPNNTFLFHYPHIWTNGALGQNQGYEPHCALRDGDWKVIYLYHNDRWELYNLAADIDESNNLAAGEPDKLMEMSRKMVRLIEERTGQYPENPATGLPIPLVMSDLPAVDVDNDGIPDNTEDANRNGIVDPGETNPDSDDTDGDRTVDGAELRLGIDPLDSDSYFSLDIQRVTLPDGTLQITWPSAPGTFFTIHSSNTLTNWTGVITNGLPASAGSATSFNVGTPGSGQAFYRVMLED